MTLWHGVDGVLTHIRSCARAYSYMLNKRACQKIVPKISKKSIQAYSVLKPKFVEIYAKLLCMHAYSALKSSGLPTVLYMKACG